MNRSIESFLNHLYEAITLKTYGWQRRNWSANGLPVTQWQDPNTGIWYSSKTALKLVRIQALEHLDID